jgi:hypothetical protein
VSTIDSDNHARASSSLSGSDQRIRYRADELAALTNGRLFRLADGNATLDTIAQRFLTACRNPRRRIPHERRVLADQGLDDVCGKIANGVTTA